MLDKIFAIVLLWLVVIAAYAQKPAEKPQEQPPALSASESYHLTVLNNRFKALQAEVDDLYAKQKEVIAEYQETTRLISTEHQGYQVNAQQQLVPIQNAPVKSAEPTPAAPETPGKVKISPAPATPAKK